MEWREVNCLIEALVLLVERYDARLREATDEDERADLSNDRGYTEILLGHYRRVRDELARLLLSSIPPAEKIDSVQLCRHLLDCR
jgi:hypothetical protein